MRLESYAKTDTGLVRSANQDSVGCFPNLGLFAVADGMGGHDAGEVASRMAIEGLEHYFGRSRKGNQSEHLLEAFRLANQEIFEAGQGKGKTSPRPMGTTLVALTLSGSPRRVRWAHVGDSRLYRYRKDDLQLLTADHTVFGNRIDDGAEIPLDLPHTNELLAALGIESAVEPGASDDAWQAGDVYLLCSDGISGLLSPEQIRTELSSRRSVDKMGAHLVEQALEAGGSDNASVVIIRVGSSA